MNWVRIFSFSLSFIAFSSVVAGPFGPLHSIEELSPSKQQLAKAIVRITTPHGAGTGFFVSADGKLVTNHHVLGPDNCFRQGCYVGLDLDYQHGLPWKKTEHFFAKPLAENEERDTTVFQIYRLDGGGKPGEALKENAFIPYKKHQKLKVSSTISIVGHPNAGLKREASGEILKSTGDWYESTACAVAGVSGSPVFDENDDWVGIVHSGTEITQEILDLNATICVSAFSDVTALGDLLVRVKDKKFKPNISEFVSLAPIKDLAEIEPPFEPFFNLRLAKVPSAREKNGEGEPLLPIFKLGCEAEVDSEEAHKHVDFSFEYCTAGMNYINCNDPEDGRGYKSCPKAREQGEWKKLFAQIAEIEELKNQDPVEWSVFAPAIFAPSEKAARAEARKALAEHLLKHPSDNDLELALYVARASHLRSEFNWQGRDLFAVWSDYTKAPHYSPHSLEISQIFEHAVDQKLISRGEAQSFLEKFVADPKIPVLLKMDAENVAFKAREFL